LSSNKRQIELDEKLVLKMRKGVQTYTNNTIFGDDDLIEGKDKYKSTTIAKTH